MLAVMAIYAGYVKVRISLAVIKGVLWIMFVMFFLNTIGNLFSNNDLEKTIFTPITVLLSLGCLRLAINK
jgi:ABC-type transport system involved in cytochrome bd biosynthesis fused ATPase/permease subunit